MRGKKAADRQSLRPGDTGGNFLWFAIEDGRRKAGSETAAGEKIGAEEESLFRMQQSHMARSVAWQMDSDEAAFRECIPVVVPPAYREGLPAWQVSANGFQDSAKAAGISVAILAGAMAFIQPGGGNPGSRTRRERSRVEDVIEMPMSEDDSGERQAIPATSPQHLLQQLSSPKKPCIDQIEGVAAT